MNLPNKPKILAATYNPVSNTKMISFLVDFPTVLLAELRTHRILTQGSLYEHMELDDFNLSANSARAIPHNKYLQKVLDNPFVPIWTKQQKGMSGEQLKDTHYENGDWNDALEQASYYQELLLKRGVHKQNANRLLSPFAYTTCIISGTKWSNFFGLRCPKYNTENKIFYSKKQCLRELEISGSSTGLEFNSDFNWESINISPAQPEFQVVAEMLYDLYQEADWKESKYHIPFENEIEKLYTSDLMSMGFTHNEESWYEHLMLISASMCAKLSYNTQDNPDTLEKHLERANMLIKSKHWEPFSHQAVAMDNDECQIFTKSYLVKNRPTSINGYLLNNKGIVEGYKDIFKVTEHGICYNLKGFISQRYILENL